MRVPRVLEMLRKKLQASLQAAGYCTDNRRFTARVTLVRRLSGCGGALERAGVVGPTVQWAVPSLCRVHSTALASGAS